MDFFGKQYSEPRIELFRDERLKTHRLIEGAVPGHVPKGREGHRRDPRCCGLGEESLQESPTYASTLAIEPDVKFPDVEVMTFACRSDEGEQFAVFAFGDP